MKRIPSLQLLQRDDNTNATNMTSTSPPSLKRRRRQHQSIPWNSLSLVLICALLWSPAEVFVNGAKLRLIPKNKNKNNKKQTNNNEHVVAGKDKTNHGKNHVKHGTKVILQPRKKQQTQTAQQQPFSLQATISQNEKGEQVLLLTQESAQVVQDAMQQTGGGSATTTINVPDLEAPEPKVLFYDPDQVLTTKAGEAPPLPHAFDEDGNRVDLLGKDVHVVHPGDPELISTQSDETVSTNTTQVRNDTPLK